MELGGFAENPKEIDGDFNAFNYCLAELYVDAMYGEDFELIGEIDECFFDDICYWIDYDGKHGNKKIIDDLKNAKMITIKNRNIIDAIYDNSAVCLASIYLNKRIYSPKLILTILLSDDDFYQVFLKDLKEEEYDKIFIDLFDCIEKEYLLQENKIEFLNKIKNNSNRIFCSKDYKKKPILNNYSWVKYLKK